MTRHFLNVDAEKTLIELSLMTHDTIYVCSFRWIIELLSNIDAEKNLIELSLMIHDEIYVCLFRWIIIINYKICATKSALIIRWKYTSWFHANFIRGLEREVFFFSFCRILLLIYFFVISWNYRKVIYILHVFNVYSERLWSVNDVLCIHINQILND